MDTHIRGLELGRQGILQVTGKQNAAFNKLITVAQHNFTGGG
jgi:hypothetical protein